MQSSRTHSTGAANCKATAVLHDHSACDILEQASDGARPPDPLSTLRLNSHAPAGGRRDGADSQALPEGRSSSQALAQGRAGSQALSEGIMGSQALSEGVLDSQALLEDVMNSQALTQGTMHGPVQPADTNGHRALLESLVESQLTSLERLVAMQVMFYHMAARVASFW